MRPVLGPHACTDRTRDTRDAEPWLPAPEDGRPGEGQRLTPGAPHNGGRHPPGTPFRHSHGERRQPARAHAVGPVLGPHARTDRTRDTRDAEPWLPAPEDGRLGEGQRMTPGAPHNDGRQPPPGDALPPPPRRATPARKGARCGASAGSPRPHRPHPGHTGRGTLTARSRGRTAGGWTAPDAGLPSQWWKTPPPGDAPPPPPQRATPARKGARCGTGAGSTRPHRPHPRHTGRGTLAARSRGRAVGEGTAPDTRRPSQRWKAPPIRDALPPPPKRATPARKGARCGAGAGPTRPHRPHPGHTGRGTLAARSGGRATGRGTAPNTRRPSQRWKAPPRGCPSTTPTPSNAPAHQRTSHGTSAPHPLLLDTATQQWRNPRHHARHAPDLRRWTKHTRSSGRWDSETAKETPTRGRGHGLRPGGIAGAPHGRRARGTCAAGGQRTRDLPRVETGPLHWRRLVPQTAHPARPR